MAGGAWLIDAAAHELLLFAAVGLLIGGLDDLAIDLIFFARRGFRNVFVYARHARASAATLPPPVRPGRLAVFVGAWDEAGVIGRMLDTARTRWGDAADYRIYVGCYPNDYPTLWELHRFASDAKVRIVHGDRDGPTTKAEALNRCWEALLADEAAEGARVKAVVLHDAEDVVHRDELRVFASLIERFHLVQLPVLPIAERSWIAGHYADEFAESHAKQMVVREAMGASVPAAGTGCAISRHALDRMAAAHEDRPFDPDTLTEDYEIGLKLGAAGGRAAFVRIAAREGGAPVAVRAHFPATWAAAVRQKARWIDGIALAGWDRLGWSGGPAEAWMRLRDRRAPLAALVLAAGYLGALLALVGAGVRWALGEPAFAPWRPDALGVALALLLAWRLAMRALFVGRAYGWRAGLAAMPRLVIANAVLIASTARALRRYASAAPQRWDKTAHVFPDILPAE